MKVTSAGGWVFGAVASLVVVLTGCSGPTGSNNPAAPGNDDKGKQGPHVPYVPQIPLVKTNLRFESNVDPDRAKALTEAVSYLYAFPLKTADPEMARIMKLQDIKPETMQAWLEERVSIIVDENYSLGGKLSYSPKAFTYENPGLLPQELDETMTLRPFSASVGGIVMQNLTGGIYLLGKERNRLLDLQVDGIGTVSVTSPRVGLLQIGSGMFKIFADSSYHTNRIFHVSTLFHEARHSDGNGKSASFPHVLCPVGHKYQGLNACDRSSNGPYTVGALVQKALMDNCAACDAPTTSELKSLYLDVLSRVLRGTVTLPTQPQKTIDAVPSDYDDAPEGHR